MSSNRFALIIANDQYEDEGLSKLEAPKFDAYALAEVLGDPETCNFYVQLAVNKKSYTVNQLIESFFDNRKRDHLLLLYFSGHGIKDEDGQLYFATPNTRQNRLLSTAVSASLVNQLMRRTRSRSQILLLDCCYSGAFAKGMIAKSGSAIGSKIGTNEYFQGRGRVVLTASDSMQYAFEEDKLVEKGTVNSIFTSAIVEGIRTWDADDNNDNRISIQELYDYVDGYVQERTPNQQPVMWSFNTRGEMIIAEREYAPEMDDEVVEYAFERKAIPDPEETQPPVEIDQPSVEIEPTQEIQSSMETVQPSVEIEQPSVETEQPSVEIELPSVELESVETEQPVEVEQPPVEVEHQPIEIEQPPVEIVQEEIEPPSQEVQPAVETVQPSAEIEQPSVEAEHPPVEIEHVETMHPPVEVDQPPVEIEQPIIETDQPSVEVEPTQEIQSSVEPEQPSVDTEPPSVELESVETEQPVEVEQPPVEVEQPTEETAPPSQVKVSAELVKPIIEEPTYSKKFPIKPVILVAIILVAIIGKAYWPSTDGGGGVPVIKNFSVDGSTLSWSVSGTNNVSINQGIGAVASSGTTTVSPDETTTYTLTISKGGRSIDETVLVEVPVVEYFLKTGGSTLRWSVSDATSASIDQGIGSVALSGTTTVSPDETTTYTLTASKGGRSTEATVQVTVEESRDPVIEYFTSEGSTLSWSVSGASHISIEPGIGGVALSGSTEVTPRETTTYTLTADNVYSTVYAFRTIVVTPPSTLKDTIKIGYIVASSSAWDTTVPLVEEIITPDLDAYADSLGLDVKFEFIIESADSQAAVHLERVQEFKAMGVDIFIGGLWSSQAQASLSYVNANDMLMVSSSSTSQLLAIENDRLFRICPTDAVQAPAIGAMWDSWGVDAVLIVQRGDYWGDGIYMFLIPELEDRGIEVIGRIRYGTEVTDFSSYLSTMDNLLDDAIAEYGADRVGVQTIMFNEMVNLVSQTSAYSNTRKVIWMGCENAGRNQNMIDEAGGKQVDLRMFSAIMWPPDSAEWESLESRYFDLTSQSAGFYTATNYDAAWILAKSIIETNSVDASTVADALPDVSDNHNGVSGLTTLDEKGDREPGFFNIWGYADNSEGFALYGTFDGNTKNIVWDDEELANQGVSRPD